YMDRATDIVALVDEMLVLFHRAAVEQAVPGAGTEAQLHAAAIARYAATLAPEELQLFYQALLLGKRDMALAPDPRSGLEMLVLRLLAFQPLPTAFSAALAEGGATAAQAAANSRSAAAALSSGPEAATVKDTSSGQKQAVAVKKKPLATEAPAAAGAVSASPSVASSPDFAVQQLDARRWCEVFGALPLSGMVRAIAENMLPVAADKGSDAVVFALRRDDALLYKPEHSARIADALSMYFGSRIDVEVRLVEDWSAAGLPAEGPETPAGWRARRVAERQQTAVESIRDDAGAQALIEAFDARIEIDSVEPLVTTDSDAGKTRAVPQE
ncbi:MAG: DNA polymerase III subunit gamma/tau C-terminal domain-containing protein, partial [Pseudomonadales bacterium]